MNQPTTPPTFPAWFAARQQAAWQKYLALPTPKRGDEAWRFSSFAHLNLTNYTSADAGDSNNLTKTSQGTATAAARFVFQNHTLIQSENHLPKGVICTTLAEALIAHSDLVEKYFMRRETRLGSAKFAALHEASLQNGVFIYVPEGVQLEENIEITHYLSGVNTLHFPHTLIVTEKDAKVRVLETFYNSSDEEQTLAVAVNDLIAAEHSTLDYVAVQALNEHSKIITINAAETAAAASSTNFLLSTGAAWARSESLSLLTGEEARSNMLAVSVPSHEQEYDQRTFQHHASAGAYSDLLYKNSLYDHALTTFSGLIFVDENAHRTDAYQTCRNLLMSDNAEANSMPGLEINADDVKCSHGSTSCPISDEEIFYLQARGIHASTARHLIARGFSNEVICRLNHEPTEELLHKHLDLKFATLTA